MKPKSIKKRIGPWEPVEYHSADAMAIQALINGVADQEQQKRAIKWIIEVACGTYDQSFWPGPDGQRSTDFAEGRRFVGNTIIKMNRLVINALRRSEE